MLCATMIFFVFTSNCLRV